MGGGGDVDGVVVIIGGAAVVVVVRFSEFPVPEQSGFPSPTISNVAGADVVTVPTRASNPIDFKRDVISCAGGVYPLQSVH